MSLGGRRPVVLLHVRGHLLAVRRCCFVLSMCMWPALQLFRVCFRLLLTFLLLCTTRAWLRVGPLQVSD